MLGCRVAVGFRRELGLLESYVSGHVFAGIAARQFEHAVVERMEARQRNELEFVAHRAQLALESGDGAVVEIFLPVERGRTVVGKQFAGIFLVDGFGKLPRKGEIRLAGFAPDQIGIGCVGEAARNGLLDAIDDAIVALGGALAGAERFVVFIDVRSD